MGQRVMSAVVDVVFFIVIGLLGYVGRLSEATLAVLFTAYATGRFGVAIGKQQMRAYADGTSNGGGGSGSGPSSGGSTPRMQAVVTVEQEPAQGRRYVAPPVTIPREDPRRSRVSRLTIEPQSPIVALGSLIHNALRG